MSESLPSQYLHARRKFIEAGGQTTHSFGFGRIIGQTYALLYLSPKPLCLNDIVTELGVSKASVSTTVRLLESWTAIRRVWVKGDRKDYYEAETDFNVLLRSGLLTVIRKKLETAGKQLDQVEGSLVAAIESLNGNEHEEVDTVAKRLRQAKQFHKKLSDLLGNPLIDHFL